MRLARPIYESLQALYLLGGLLSLFGSYRLHSGVWSLLLLLSGIAALIAGTAVWLRRRDYRAADAEYWSRKDTDDDALR
ncbi:MAG TPA: hypothetical protein VHZ99_01275 [Steroidobacteraceae bacterium]|nr:hypothetical protein [Steroidobacteraceae bacterium]